MVFAHVNQVTLETFARMYARNGNSDKIVKTIATVNRIRHRHVKIQTGHVFVSLVTKDLNVNQSVLKENMV